MGTKSELIFNNSKTIYDDYCTTIDFRLAMGDLGEIGDICDSIALFADEISDLIKETDIQYPIRRYKLNEHELKHKNFFKVRDDQLSEHSKICRKKDQGFQRCNLMYSTQDRDKGFIPQMYHIVQEFGILLPLNIYNLNHSKKNLIKRTSEKIFGMTPLEYKMKSEEERNMEVLFEKMDISLAAKLRSIGTDSERQSWVDEIFKRINTVKILRYFELYACNNIDNPMKSTNIEHIEMYNGLDDILRNVTTLINVMNTEAEGEEDGYLIRIPEYPHFNTTPPRRSNRLIGTTSNSENLGYR